MKRLIILVFACILTILPVVKAQDCSNWSNWDLRGTYTLSGSGYIDLSKAFPGAGLPSGMSPMSWVGAHAYNGTGGSTGWISFNMGGTQINAQYVGYTYSMKPDCSVQVSFRLKLTDLGITSGVNTSLKVVVPRPAGQLELHSTIVGNAFGTSPGTSVGLEVMQRISM